MRLTRCKPLLGTFVEVSVDAALADLELLSISNTIFDRISYIEKKMSYYQLGSELHYLNKYAHQTPLQLSNEMATVLEFCLDLSQLTDGLFDITVTPKLINKGLLPNHGLSFDETGSWQDISIENKTVFFEKSLIIELGGVAKGFAVDEALKVVNKPDIDMVVNAGGDLKMSPWQGKNVAVRIPGKSVDHSHTIIMKNAALATSGHYFLEQKPAITHPKQSINLDLKQSVSVFASSCMLADALTKIAVLCDDYEPIFSMFDASSVTFSDSKLNSD